MTVPRQIRIGWEQDSERSTLIHDTFRYKNEFKMETSVSRRCLQRKIAQMLERSQSLLQYYNNIASMQDWYSADHGSHTPQLDVPGIAQLLKRAEGGGAEQTIVILGCEHRDGCAKLSETIERWTSRSQWSEVLYRVVPSYQQHLRQEERHRQEAHPNSSCHYDFSRS